MRKLMLGILGTIALVGSPAMAADLSMPVKAPPYMPPAPVQNWTGCYVGAGGGGAMWNQDNNTYSVTTGFGTQIAQTAGGRGWFGTAQIGCDYQIAPAWVLGAFADYNWSNIRGELGSLGLAIVGTEKLSSSWAAGGRIGYLPFERLMVFGSAGFTEANFDGVNFTGLAAGAVVDTMASRSYDGFFLGSGYEYVLGWFPGLTWKTEYRFASYRPANNLILAVPTGAVLTGLSSHKYTQEIRSELVWRFNMGGPVARY